jgi:hypothetical protein
MIFPILTLLTATIALPHIATNIASEIAGAFIPGLGPLVVGKIGDSIEGKVNADKKAADEKKAAEDKKAADEKKAADDKKAAEKKKLDEEKAKKEKIATALKVKLENEKIKADAYAEAKKDLAMEQKESNDIVTAPVPLPTNDVVTDQSVSPTSKQ